MFYDGTLDYGPRRTVEEQKIHDRYTEESIKAKTYGEEYWAKDRRDQALARLPAHQRSK